MKRMALLLALAILSTVLFVGCAGADEEQTQNSAGGATDSMTQAPAEDSQGSTLPPAEIVVDGTQAPTQAPTESQQNQGNSTGGVQTPAVIPTEPEATPAPTEPDNTPTPTEPETTPAPIEPEATPAPTEPEATPAPTEPDNGYFPWYG